MKGVNRMVFALRFYAPVVSALFFEPKYSHLLLVGRSRKRPAWVDVVEMSLD